MSANQSQINRLSKEIADLRKTDAQETTAVEAAIPNICKRIYRTIELDGYARLDFRLADSGELYFLEANPNPEIAEKEEFARSAKHAQRL